MSDEIKIPIEVEFAESLEKTASFVNSMNRSLSGITTRQAEDGFTRLNRQSEQLKANVEKNAKAIQVYEEQMKKASGVEADSIKKTMEGLERVNEKYRDNIRAIEQKKVALEGQTALAQTTSQKEKDIIEANTRARIAEIQTVRDTTKAHNQNTTAVDSGADAVKKYFAGFSAASLAMVALNTISKEMEKQKKYIEDTANVVRSLNQGSAGKYESLSGFYNEANITDEGKQKQAKGILDKIAGDNNLKISDVYGAASHIAGAVGINESNFGEQGNQDFIKTQASLESRGYDAQSSKEMIHYFQQQYGAQGKKFTAADYGREVGQIGAAAGSPSEATGLMGAIQDLATTPGADYQSTMKLYRNYIDKGASPSQAAEMTQQFFKGRAKFNSMDLQETAQKVGNLNQQGLGVTMGDITSTDANGHLVPDFGKAVSMFGQNSGKMTTQQQEASSELIMGIKNRKALENSSGFQNTKLPSGLNTSPMNNRFTRAGSYAEQTQNQLEDFIGESFEDETKYTADISTEKELMTSRGLNRRSLKEGTSGFTSNDDELAAGMVLTKKLIKAAQIRDQIGKTQGKDSPQYKQLSQYIKTVAQEILWAGSDESFINLENGDEGTINSASADPDKWASDVLKHNFINPDVLNPKSAGGAAAALANQQVGPPAPVVLNQNRIVNYGQSYSDMGSPTPTNNQFNH